jgi:hypothetical protein
VSTANRRREPKNLALATFLCSCSVWLQRKTPAESGFTLASRVLDQKISLNLSQSLLFYCFVKTHSYSVLIHLGFSKLSDFGFIFATFGRLRAANTAMIVIDAITII